MGAAFVGATFVGATFVGATFVGAAFVGAAHGRDIAGMEGSHNYFLLLGIEIHTWRRRNSLKKPRLALLAICSSVDDIPDINLQVSNPNPGHTYILC